MKRVKRTAKKNTKQQQQETRKKNLKFIMLILIGNFHTEIDDQTNIYFSSFEFTLNVTASCFCEKRKLDKQISAYLIVICN